MLVPIASTKTHLIEFLAQVGQHIVPLTINRFGSSRPVARGCDDRLPVTWIGLVSCPIKAVCSEVSHAPGGDEVFSIFSTTPLLCHISMSWSSASVRLSAFALVSFSHVTGQNLPVVI